MISESTNRAGMTFIGGWPLLVPNLERYWRDPAAYDRDQAVGQAKIDRLFEPHDARVRADWERIWAENAREQNS